MSEEGCLAMGEFLFLVFDSNGDQQIDKDEFYDCCNYQMKRMRKPAVKRGKTDEMFEMGDTNNDGSIDL